MTKHISLFVITILWCLSSYSQQINMNVCNETSNIAARNACVKGYIESLIINEIAKVEANSDKKPEELPFIKLTLAIDAIGNLSPIQFEASHSWLQEVTRAVIKKIRPLDTFKNTNGELISDEISIHIKAPFPGIMSPKKVKLEDSEDADKDDSKDTAFAIIEQVPIFPGCYSSSNAELKSCMSTYVSKHVVNNFNLNVARGIGLPSGKVRISVQFKIDKQGYVVNTRARASRPELEAEAIRVVSAIPKLQPGEQRGEVVGVLYALPIIFEYEESFSDRKERIRRERKANRKKS